MPTVTVEVSSVISHPPAAVWKAVSYFGDTFNYQLPTAYSPQQACGQDAVHGAKPLRRFVYIGNGRLCEELVLVDNERYAMKWKLASEGGGIIHPFPASLCDYRWVLRLEHVSVSNKTFVKVQSAFRTENEMVGIMHAQWQQAFESMLESLEERLRENSGVPPSLNYNETPQLGAKALKSRSMSAPDLGQDHSPPSSARTLHTSLSQAGGTALHQRSGPLPPSPLQDIPSGNHIVRSRPPLMPNLSLASWTGRSVPPLVSSTTKAQPPEPTRVPNNHGNCFAVQSPQINATPLLDLPSLRLGPNAGQFNSWNMKM